VFCVGEPWNTVASREGSGVTLLATTDILPQHPEKVLAVARRFAEQMGGLNGPVMTSLVRAVLRGCMWCAEQVTSGPSGEGGGELTEMLARPEYLAQPVEILRESLSINRDFGANKHQKGMRKERSLSAARRTGAAGERRRFQFNSRDIDLTASRASEVE